MSLDRQLAFGVDLAIWPQLKIRRGRGYLRDAIARADEWSASGAVRFEILANADQHSFDVVFRVGEPQPAEEISLTFGDALHNLRGGMDAFAWELSALDGPHSNNKRKDVYFPAALSVDAWNDLTPKLSTIPAEILDRIRQCQPFQLGDENAARLDPLAVIARMSNSDKHRGVVAALASHSSVNGSFSFSRPPLAPGEVPKNGDLNIEFGDNSPVEDGKLWARLTTSIPMLMGAEPPATIGFEWAVHDLKLGKTIALAAFETAAEQLQQVMDYVRTGVGVFASNATS
jgi:hypothetical protein